MRSETRRVPANRRLIFFAYLARSRRLTEAEIRRTPVGLTHSTS